MDSQAQIQLHEHESAPGLAGAARRTRFHRAKGGFRQPRDQTALHEQMSRLNNGWDSLYRGGVIKLQQSPCVPGTARSDNQDLNRNLTWEDYKSQRAKDKQAARMMLSATIAQENEALFLGNSVSDKESDLLEFSPVIQPVSTPTTSICPSPAPLHTTAAIGSNPGFQLAAPVEYAFGNMVLQDIRPFKPAGKQPVLAGQESGLQVEILSNEPECLLEAPPVLSCFDPGDLIELW